MFMFISAGKRIMVCILANNQNRHTQSYIYIWNTERKTLIENNNSGIGRRTKKKNKTKTYGLKSTKTYIT